MNEILEMSDDRIFWSKQLIVHKLETWSVPFDSDEFINWMIGFDNEENKMNRAITSDSLIVTWLIFSLTMCMNEEKDNGN